MFKTYWTKVKKIWAWSKFFWTSRWNRHWYCGVELKTNIVKHIYLHCKYFPKNYRNSLGTLKLHIIITWIYLFPYRVFTLSLQVISIKTIQFIYSCSITVTLMCVNICSEFTEYLTFRNGYGYAIKSFKYKINQECLTKFRTTNVAK